ncbi:hypothetical protein CHS0354_014031 [Potamilus streckersoni]|uniref:Uncharacterized protein n=1 Tax=Potamilus streckersoni TaxID=2493646 RepID=A0AAE0RUN4_9BIVA|nr:hypothetical protein CHS0354_014031 [Potamilus streckersoni]
MPPIDHLDGNKKQTADEQKQRIVFPESMPKGNFLAQYIRSIHDNTRGLFPSTAGSQRSYNKYNSVTHLSFTGPPGYKEKEEEEGMDYPKKRLTIEDVLLAPKTHQMFNRWQVPDRLIPQTPNSARPDNCGQAGTQPTRISRQVSLPNIPLKSPSQSGFRASCKQPQEQQVVLSKSAVMAAQRVQEVEAPRRAKTTLSFKSIPKPPTKTNKLLSENKSEENSLMEPLTQSLQPEAIFKAEEWIKKANQYEKKVVEKVLRMASKSNEIESSLRRSLLPDARTSVEKWLKEANEKERDVALKFFNSLSGSQLMGMTAPEKRKRLKQVIETLEDGHPQANNASQKQRPLEKKDGSKRHYIRLLTPNTRKNRWMYTTWHHLPTHKNYNIVENWSSHYIRPHEPVPRHFVIHPDWG